MRILQISPVYPPYKGGMGLVAEKYTHILWSAGHEVDVISVTTHQPIIRWGNAGIIFNIIWEIKKYDIIHLHYPFYGTALLTALFAKIYSKPLIVTYHMEPEGQGLLGRFFQIYRIVVRPIIMKLATNILVSSIDYQQAYLGGISASKRIEFPFTVNTQIFKKQENTIREKLGIDSGVKLMIFVGGLDDAHYFKGVDVLLEACAKLHDIQWHLLLIGDGNQRENFERLAERLGIGDNITFLGRVESTAPYYAASDLHILPSIHKGEAFGLVTLEAAATGIPSIVSDLPGVRTLVREGQTGWLAIPGDPDDLSEKIDQALSNTEVLQRMGMQAREMVEKQYTEAKLAQRLQKVYEMVK